MVNPRYLKMKWKQSAVKERNGSNGVDSGFSIQIMAPQESEAA